MTIAELERRSGLTRANIRFYEAEGLLRPARRENGYRDYSEEDLALLLRVRLLRELGLPLAEIRGSCAAGTWLWARRWTRTWRAWAWSWSGRSAPRRSAGTYSARARASRPWTPRAGWRSCPRAARSPPRALTASRPSSAPGGASLRGTWTSCSAPSCPLPPRPCSSAPTTSPRALASPLYAR